MQKKMRIACLAAGGMLLLGHPVYGAEELRKDITKPVADSFISLAFTGAGKKAVQPEPSQSPAQTSSSVGPKADEAENPYTSTSSGSYESLQETDIPETAKKLKEEISLSQPIHLLDRNGNPVINANIHCSRTVEQADGKVYRRAGPYFAWSNYQGLTNLPVSAGYEEISIYVKLPHMKTADNRPAEAVFSIPVSRLNASQTLTLQLKKDYIQREEYKSFRIYVCDRQGVPQPDYGFRAEPADSSGARTQAGMIDTSGLGYTNAGGWLETCLDLEAGNYTLYSYSRESILARMFYGEHEIRREFTVTEQKETTYVLVVVV